MCPKGRHNIRYRLVTMILLYPNDHFVLLKVTHMGYVYQTVAHRFYIGVSIIFIESGQIIVKNYYNIYV